MYGNKRTYYIYETIEMYFWLVIEKKLKFFVVVKQSPVYCKKSISTPLSSYNKQ